MATGEFHKAQVTGVLTWVPKGVRNIDDEVDLYGGNAAQIERIRKTIGLGSRRVASPGETTADLCEKAALALLESMQVPASAVDALICVTQTPDHFQPANACILHGRLHLSPACAAFDVNLGCSGWVYGLWLAHMMIETGSCSRVLLLAGDTLSRQVNPRDRSVAPLFGDAGSATLVEAAPQPSRAVFSLHTDGSGHEAIIVPAGAFRAPHSPEAALEATDEEGNIRSPLNLRMAGADVFNFSLKVEPEALRQIAERAGRPLETADYLFLHQANRYILGNIARRLRLPQEKIPSAVVERYGNQSSASVPGVLCDTLGPKGTDRSLSVIVSGFGVGLSWASAWIEIPPLRCCRMQEEV